MSKKNQILVAILLIMMLVYFIWGMLLPTSSLWLKIFNLLIMIGWGILFFAYGKVNKKNNKIIYFSFYFYLHRQVVLKEIYLVKYSSTFNI